MKKVPITDVEIRQAPKIGAITRIHIHATIHKSDYSVSLYARKSTNNLSDQKILKRLVWEGLIDLLANLYCEYDGHWKDIWRVYRADIDRQINAAIKDFNSVLGP